MRKFIALLLFMSMITVFSACGSGGSTANKASVETPQSSVASVSTPATQEQEQPSDTIEATTSVQEDQPEAIILSWDELGEYGSERTLHGGSVPYSYIEFHIPTGTYQVTNNGTIGSQVSIYDDGINVRDDGYEEPIAGDGGIVVLMPGDSGVLTVGEGQYVKLADSSENIYFVRTGD